MAEDSYSSWLKLPPGPRPLDCYALLGLPRFCDDLVKIEDAAQKQLDRLDRHAMTPDPTRRDACQQMMNEVARARIILTDPTKRLTYDRSLGADGSPPVDDHKATTEDAAKIKASAAANSLRATAIRLFEILRPVLRLSQRSAIVWAPGLASAIVLLTILFIWHPGVTRHESTDVAVAVASPSRPTPTTTPSSRPLSTSASQPAVADASKTSGGRSELLRPATDPAGAKPQDGLSNDGRSIADAAKATGSSGQPAEVQSPANPPATSPAPVNPTLVAPAPAVAPSLLPIPSAASQQASGLLVDQLFSADIAAATTAEMKSALARRLIQIATDTRDDPIGCYMLFKRAADLAVGAEDVPAALAAVDACGKQFQSDEVSIKSRLVTAVARRLTKSNNHQDLAKLADEVFDKAVAADRYAVARSTLSAAIAAAETTRDAAWLAALKARLPELDTDEGRYDQIKQAQATLAKSPQDAAANTLVGRYRCFFKGDWSGGLPMLAVGADPATRDLAKLELGQPAEPQKLLQLANGWWALIQPPNESIPPKLALHVRDLYQRVLPSLTALERGLALKRSSAASRLMGRVIDLMPLIDAKTDSVRGRWEMQRDGLLMTDDDYWRLLVIRYSPPPEYDFRIEFDALDARVLITQSMNHSGRQFQWEMGSTQFTGYKNLYTIDCIDHRIPNRSSVEGPVLAPKSSHVSVVEVRRDSITTYLDGERLSVVGGDLSSLSILNVYNSADKFGAGLAIGGGSSNAMGPALFTRIELVEITGHGVRLSK